MPTIVRRNIAINPSNEAAGGWASSNAATYPVSDDTTVYLYGTRSKKSAPVSAGIGVPNGAIMSAFNIGGLNPCAVGKRYTLSVFFRHNVNPAVDPRMLTRIGWAYLDSGQTVIGAPVYNPLTTMPWNSWERYYIIADAGPSNAAYIRLYGSIAHSNNVVTDANDAAWMDGCLIEEGTNLGSYFDGSSVAAPPITFSWAAGANASQSIATMADLPVARNDTIYTSLVAGGYGPGSIADMEYKRLLAANALVAPQPLTLYDLYARAGERPRLRAGRR